ncbi:MAG TPA: prolipoprotein diacylglyceryl transferase family protein, partial [Candidatus Limnocylindrales bacterium]|nr:prolipoprotein diacylglyceryl transferase family protein [Candidatus Limnocylindrales bacterium]
VVASLLDGGARRWAATAAPPLLVVLALGKAALALGGTGQGVPSDASWATAYAGPGPWGSLAPSVPSHPAQLYEAGAYLVALVVVVASLAAVGRSARWDGRLLGAVLVLVGLVRLAVGATWRDAIVLGPLRSGQLLALAPFGLGLVLVLAWRRAPLADGRSSATEPAWPDPAVAQGWRTGPER